MAPAASIEKMMAEMTPEQGKAAMEEWRKWMKKNEAVLADGGAPLGKTKRVTSDGIADVKNEVTGYSIVEAESHEAAADIFKDNPNLQIPGGYIDILDIVPMPQ